jgi:hypothetical protein
MAKRKHPTELPTAADLSRNGRRNSQNSPWRTALDWIGAVTLDLLTLAWLGLLVAWWL